VSSPSVALSVSGTSSPVTVTGTFAANTSYTFTLAAVNANGTSVTSSESNSITPNTVYALSQTFNASGTYTVPNNVNTIAVYVHGSSGAGFTGRQVYQFGGGTGGSGGFGGSLAFFQEHQVSPGTNFAVTIGSGGERVPNDGNSPGNNLVYGGSTTFGNLLTVNGSQSANGNGEVGIGNYNSNLNNVLFASGGNGGNAGLRANANDQNNGAGMNTANSGGSGGSGTSITPSNTSLPTLSSGGGGGGGGGGAYADFNSSGRNGASGGAGSGNAGSGGAGGNGKGTSPRTSNVGTGGNPGTQPSGGGGGGGGSGLGYVSGTYSLDPNQAGGLGASGRVIVYGR
jgi:hypothetical protein